jgi:hypothetical protein
MGKVTTSAAQEGLDEDLCPLCDTTCHPTTLAHGGSLPTVAYMNENHANLCSGPEWAAYLEEEILLPLVRDVDLGDEMLEIGPGYGAATEWLQHRVKRTPGAARCRPPASPTGGQPTTRP